MGLHCVGWRTRMGLGRGGMTSNPPQAAPITPSSPQNHRDHTDTLMYARRASVFIRFARIATFTLTLAYPVVVYLGLLRFSTRQVALVIVALSCTLALARVGKLAWLPLRRAIAPLLPTVLTAMLAGISGEPSLLLVTPVVINLALLVTFAATLRAGKTPFVERFALLAHPHLTAAQREHCRGVTWVWVGFFALNAAVSAGLAAWAPFDWWALHCGLIAYLCIGALMAGEWLVRRHRFGHASERSPAHANEAKPPQSPS